MSHVTNVILAVGVDNWDDCGSPGCDTPSQVLALNKLLQREFGQQLADADAKPNVVGGTRHLEICVWIAAFNYVPKARLEKLVADLPWANPAQVQLMICDQDDDVFTVRTVSQLREKVRFKRVCRLRGGAEKQG